MSLNLGRPKPYQAQVWRDGKQVYLSASATTEEAPLCVARSPEGKAAEERAAAAPPLTSEEALQQARAEGLMLLVAESKSGYFDVRHQPGRSKQVAAKIKSERTEITPKPALLLLYPSTKHRHRPPAALL